MSADPTKLYRAARDPREFSARPGRPAGRYTEKPAAQDHAACGVRCPRAHAASSLPTHRKCLRDAHGVCAHSFFR